MKYYPALLDLKGKTCCVIGGGSIAQRKVRSLLSAGASVRVISPDITDGLKRLLESNKISWIKSTYRKDYIKPAFLVVAATDDSKINFRVWRDARKIRILANIVDSPSQSNFIVPSVIEKNGLIISISTSGKAPCLSRNIRMDLTRKFVPRYARKLEVLEAIRQELKRSCPSVSTRKTILNKILNSDILKTANKIKPKEVIKRFLKKV